jgi:hypothetical protein
MLLHFFPHIDTEPGGRRRRHGDDAHLAELGMAEHHFMPADGRLQVADRRVAGRSPSSRLRPTARR